MHLSGSKPPASWCGMCGMHALRVPRLALVPHATLCVGLSVCNCMLVWAASSAQGCGLDGISIEAEAEVKSGPFHRGQGRGRGRIEADLLALQQTTSFHFRTFIFVSSLAEDKEILSS